MYDEQTRINAAISYFFLGPLFLMAKKNTPLAEKYVQDHAKRASLIILTCLSTYVAYLLLQDWFYISLFGLSLAVAISSCITMITVAILLHGAYLAFSGKEAEGIHLQGLLSQGSVQNSTNYTSRDLTGISEEEKIRIILSFLPFIGIWLSSRFPTNEIITGRKVGSFFTICIILSSMSSHEGGFGIILALGYIAIIAISIVGVFLQNHFFILNMYRYIPTYHEIEAHVTAGCIYLYRFIKVIFGGKKDFQYREVFLQTLENQASTQGSSSGGETYFMPIEIIGIPFINLITLPSYWNKEYVAFRGLILQGITLTICLSIIWNSSGWDSSIHTIFLFPIIHLISFSRQNIHTHAPIVSISVFICKLFQQSQAFMHSAVEQKEQKLNFSYTTSEDTKK